MRIRTQLIITMLLFGIMLVVITVSAIIVNQLTRKATEQEKIASSIAEGANELSYLAQDYLVYRESQQLKRWQSRFASFSNQVASLSLHKPEQQAVMRNIQANQQRLKEVFDSVASNVGRASQNQSADLDTAFFQVSWSRMAVQSQGLISDASRMSLLLHQQTDRLREIRTMLIYLIVILFGLFLLVSYMLTYRRILKSIATLHAGTVVIGSGNLDFVIREKKNDEIGDLSHAFNQMASNLKTVTASKTDLEKEIVERKRAEEELGKQREWLRVTLSSIGDAVIATDIEGRITFLNPVAVTLTGWKSEEALGQPIQSVFSIFNEKTRMPGEDLVVRVLNEKRVVALANDTAMVTKDGHEIPIEDSAAPIFDADGNIIGVVLVFHDVSERRRIQTALRGAHERAVWLARFPEQNPNPVMRVSAEGTILYCNPASARFPGWRCEVGQALQNEVLPLFGQAMAEGEEIQQDVQIEGRFYFIWIAPFPGEGYANIYARDITERKLAEEAVHDSEKRLNRAQEIAHLGSWELDLVNNRLTWSDEVYRIFGLQPQEFEATYETFLEAVHPDDRAAVDAAYSGSLKEGRDAYEIEHRVVRKSTGEIRIVHERCEHMRDASGRIIRSIGMVHDITERKRSEEEVRDSEERFRAVFESSSDCILVWDRQYNYLYANQAAIDHVGTTRDKVIGKNIRDGLGHVPDFMHLWMGRVDRAFATGESFRVEDAVPVGSRMVHSESQISPIRDSAGRVFAVGVVYRDITERKRAEDALQQRTLELLRLTEHLEYRVQERTAELADANEALRQLSVRLLSAQEEERKRVAGEIHDTMGSCLSGIKFKVESALEEIGKTPKTATQSLNSIVPVIQEAIEECRRIQMDLRPSMLDDLGLLPTLSWLFRRFQTIYPAIHVEQETRVEESDLPDSLKTVMYRIIQEAMNNAAKHSKADLIRISIRKVHNEMELSVKDNGCGFSVQQRLFLNDSRRGLGLTSMRERTELSGGSFAIESAEGLGTIVRASWTL